MKRLIILYAVLQCIVSGFAQSVFFNPQLEEAMKYFQQKEYEKSSECYRKAIEDMRHTGNEKSIPTVQEQIAINELYIGTNFISKRDYDNAEKHLLEAEKLCVNGSKTYLYVENWIGKMYSLKAYNLEQKSLVESNYYSDKIFSLYDKAIVYYGKAKAEEKQLKTMNDKAKALKEDFRTTEAKKLLNEVIEKCADTPQQNLLKGEALKNLGIIEQDEEDYQNAILHLNEAYNILTDSNTEKGKVNAYQTAMYLHKLFEKGVPNEEKATLWKEREEKLNNENF